MSTNIEWTEETWNPVTGCDKISPGCKNCYAEILAKRLKAMGQPNYQNGFKLTLQPQMLDIPLKRRKPTVYFVNSMSDLFHKDIPDEYIDRVFGIMARCPQHVFQILTKRQARMRDYMKTRAYKAYNNARIETEQFPPRNIWLGVSVENKNHRERIDALRETPAVIRFVSFEPLLSDIGEVDLSNIDWAIVGGESGHCARPVNPDWVRSLRDQCLAQGVKFFFKQWGQWFPMCEKPPEKAKWSIGKAKALTHIHNWNDESKNVSVKIGKKNAGRYLDGKIWDEYPTQTN